MPSLHARCVGASLSYRSSAAAPRSCALFARIRALTNKIRRVGSPSDSAGLEFHVAVACPRAFLLCLRHPNTVVPPFLPCHRLTQISVFGEGRRVEQHHLKPAYFALMQQARRRHALPSPHLCPGCRCECTRLCTLWAQERPLFSAFLQLCDTHTFITYTCIHMSSEASKK